MTQSINQLWWVSPISNDIRYSPIPDWQFSIIMGHYLGCRWKKHKNYKL